MLITPLRLTYKLRPKFILGLSLFFYLLLFSTVYLFISSINIYANTFWSNITHLPYIIASNTSFNINNKIYTLGGSAATGQSKFDLLVNNIDNNNNPSSWINTLALPKALIWHASTINNKNIYILGGDEENAESSLGKISTVYIGKSDQSGNIISWTELNPLPQPLALGQAIVINNYLYYVGGVNNSGVVNPNIYFALINNDGTIGSWNIAGQLPNGGLTGEMLFTFNNKLIIAGGADKNNTYQNLVYIASTDSNGNINSWNNGPSLPFDLYRSFYVQKDNQFFIIGGNSDFDQNPHTLYTEMDNLGNLSSWTTASSSADLNNGTCCGGSTILNNYIYLVGGYVENGTPGGYQSAVLRANIDDILGTVPQIKDLNIPLIKQTDPNWANLEYDNAHLWSPIDKTIGTWGCALTSSDMILNYYGITKLPDGTLINPNTLNAWLESQDDGYIDNNSSGYVNWLAISRLSHLAKNINNLSFDDLEFSRTDGMDNNKLTNDLNNNIPDILEEPGHFIVAKGINGNTFNIDDPYYNDSKLSNIFSNQYLSISTFTKANSDLSYFMIVSDPSVKISVLDSNNKPLGSSYIQNPISNTQTPKNIKQTPIQITYIPKPASGNYKILVSSTATQNYEIKNYLYDQNGNDKIFDIVGTIDNSSSDSINLSFNKTSLNLSTQVKIVTFDSLRKDIKDGENLKQINISIGKALINLINDSEKLYQHKNKIVSKLILDAILMELETFKKIKFISTQEFYILSKDINFLKKSL